MKAFMLTEEEINKLAEGGIKPADLKLEEKEVKTHLVMPDMGMPEFAQVFKEFEGAMTREEIIAKYIKPNMIGKPYSVFVGKCILKL